MNTSSNIILFASNESKKNDFNSVEFDLKKDDEEEEGILKLFYSNMKITNVYSDKCLIL